MSMKLRQKFTPSASMLDNLAEAIREMQAALSRRKRHECSENKLKGILIGQMRLTISANPKRKSSLLTTLPVILLIPLPRPPV